MKIAIMQPYFFPYIGYFQLMNAVDKFVVYDNIEFTKKGWINRNRILLNGRDEMISLPIKKDSDYLNVKDRFLAEIWQTEKNKLLNKIKEAYRKAPYFESAIPIIEKIILFEQFNLFDFVFNSIKQINEHIGINTPLVISSSLNINHDLRADKKVIEMCKVMNANSYLNPIGGVELYEKEVFKKEGIQLTFHKTNEIKYPQFENDFIPFLSIVDVMMFNSKESISKYLKMYSVL